MNSFDMYYSGKKINFKKLINYIIDWLDDNKNLKMPYSLSDLI